MNVAVTVWVLETVQVPNPLQPPPLQPAKVEPLVPCAARITVVPTEKFLVQLPLVQLNALGLLVTSPVPLPAMVTVTVKVCGGGKVVLVVVVVVIGTVVVVVVVVGGKVVLVVVGGGDWGTGGGICANRIASRFPKSIPSLESEVSGTRRDSSGDTGRLSTIPLDASRG